MPERLKNAPAQGPATSPGVRTPWRGTPNLGPSTEVKRNKWSINWTVGREVTEVADALKLANVPAMRQKRGRK